MPDEERINMRGIQAIPPGWEPIAEFGTVRAAWAYARTALRLHRQIIISPAHGKFTVWTEIHVFWIT